MMFQNENENLNVSKEDTDEAVKQVFVNLVSETPSFEEETVHEETIKETENITEEPVVTEQVQNISEFVENVAPQIPDIVEEAVSEPSSGVAFEVPAEQKTEQKKESIHDGQRNWYVIHTYSGYENKVKDNLIKRIETMNMKDKIFKVLVPTEEEVEYRDGKKRTVQKKIYPGYVLIEMIMSDDSWYVVRNTQGVTGFVGPSVRPTPVSESEIKQIMHIMGMDTGTKVKISLEVGQGIKIKSGPFKDFTGLIDEIYHDREKVKVLVFIFGRETPVELDFRQIEKL